MGHFDKADFAVTLMLRPAEAGGIYRYLSRLRVGGSAEFEVVDRVLDGDDTGCIDLYAPGGNAHPVSRS